MKLKRQKCACAIYISSIVVFCTSGAAQPALPSIVRAPAPALVMAKDSAPVWKDDDTLLFTSSRDISGATSAVAGPLQKPDSSVDQLSLRMVQSEYLWKNSKLALLSLKRPEKAAVFAVPYLFSAGA